MQTFIFFLIAALGEILGCYTFWVWLKLGKSIFWVIPGLWALVIYAAALTRIDASNAGRVYAAYGGVYLLASCGWLWLVEGVQPYRRDLLGVAISIMGTLVILSNPNR
ncbi:MAG: YnfA family protein [Nodosilinea sp.]